MTDFASTMAARSDTELLEIANAVEGTWREEALSAAQAELTRRGIPLPTRAQSAKNRADVLASRADVPLDALWAFGATAMPLLIFPWLMMASTFEREGYLRKAKRLRILTGRWATVYVTLIAIAVIGRLMR